MSINLDMGPALRVPASAEVMFGGVALLVAADDVLPKHKLPGTVFESRLTCIPVTRTGDECFLCSHPSSLP
jgi:hypothetical protein